MKIVLMLVRWWLNAYDSRNLYRGYVTIPIKQLKKHNNIVRFRWPNFVGQERREAVNRYGQGSVQEQKVS